MGFAGFGDLGFDFDAFDFEGTADDPLETRVWSRPVVRRPQACTYERALELAEALPIDNETETFAFVSGNFVFGDLLEALVDARRLGVRRLGIQTLSMSDENIDSLRNVCEMQPVEELLLVLSDYWYAHECRRGGLVGYLFDELDLDGLDLRVAFAGVHCKVVTVETPRGNRLTMHGSANLRSSGNVEQLHISPDPALWEFCDGMTRRIVDAYDVVNQGNRKRRKSVRRSALWQAAATEGAAAPGAREAAAGEAPASAGPSASGGAPRPSARPDARAAGTTCSARCPSSADDGGR